MPALRPACLLALSAALVAADPSPRLADHASDYVFACLEEGVAKLDIDSHTRDWGYVAGNRNAVLTAVSPHYVLAFDQMSYALNALAPLVRPWPEDDAVVQDLSAVGDDPLGRMTDRIPGAGYRAREGLGLSFRAVLSGTTWDLRGRPVTRSQLLKSQQTINCGRYLQQRFYRDPVVQRRQGTTTVTDTTSLDTVRSGLELCAWPDRVSWILRAEAAVAQAAGHLEAEFRYDPAAFPHAQRTADGRAVVLASGRGDGLVVMATATSTLTWDAALGTITVAEPTTAWDVGSDHAVGLSVLPCAVRAQLDGEARATDEHDGVQVAVRRLGRTLSSAGMPQRAAEAALPASAMVLDDARGCLLITEPRYDVDVDTAWQEYQVTFTNPAPRDRTIRVNFQTCGTWPGNDIGNSLLATGGACTITDDPVDGSGASLLTTGGEDLGIPVQLGKNFHQSSTDDHPDRFRGRWIHRWVMLRVPASSTQRLRVVQWYQWHDGRRAVASHAHLCTVGFNKGPGTGYGSAPDQQWDEMTLGANGESITFGLGNDHGLSFGNDVRESFTVDPARNGYGGNTGGLGLLAYDDGAGVHHTTVQEKTSYRRGGPNDTEVAYGRLSDDRTLAATAVVRLGSTDDVVRMRLHLRVDVRAPLTFRRLGFFQLGTPGYNYAYFTAMSRGEGATTAETWGVLDAHARSTVPAGAVPWFTAYGTDGYTDYLGSPVAADGTKIYALDAARANRSVVVRGWRGRLGGATVSQPSFQTWAQRDFSKQPADGTASYRQTSFLELTPPPGLSSLRSGDWLEADLDVVLLPTEISGMYSSGPAGTSTRSYPYRGPNTAFGAALAAGRDTPAMTTREATGNAVTVTALTACSVATTTPLILASTTGTGASFRLQGGLALVPVTVTGLSTYHGGDLQVQSQGAWTTVATATTAQARFDPPTRSWALTWLVPRDGLPAGSAQDYRVAPLTALVQAPDVLGPAAATPEVLILP